MVEKVVELNGTKSHNRCHTQMSGESSVGLVYVSVENSIPELILLAKVHLENVGIKDYKVPCESWVRLQFLSSNKFSDTAKRHIGRLNIQWQIQSCSAHSNHRHGYYWEILKRTWRHHIIWIIWLSDKMRRLWVHQATFLASITSVVCHQLLWTGRKNRYKGWAGCSYSFSYTEFTLFFCPCCYLSWMPWSWFYMLQDDCICHP